MANKYLQAYRMRRIGRAPVTVAVAVPVTPSAAAEAAEAAVLPPAAPRTVPPVASSPRLPPPTPINGRLVIKFTGSSNIERAELDLETSVLEVTFSKGPRWRYANVTRSMIEEWRDAPSAGRWFHGAIKSKPQDHPATPVAAAPGV